MSDTQHLLALRLQGARRTAGVNQIDAAAAAGLSQSTYSRIEDGARPLKADELILLADRFGVRSAAIAGIDDVIERARFAARTDGTSASMATMRDRAYAYLELDAYLTEQGIADA